MQNFLYGKVHKVSTILLLFTKNLHQNINLVLKDRFILGGICLSLVEGAENWKLVQWEMHSGMSDIICNKNCCSWDGNAITHINEHEYSRNHLPLPTVSTTFPASFMKEPRDFCESEEHIYCRVTYYTTQ